MEVRCWDYVDGGLAQADFHFLIRDMVQLIREFRPQAVVTFGPEGAYGHPDHITIGRPPQRPATRPAIPSATRISSHGAGSLPAGPGLPQLLPAPRRASHEPAGHLADDPARRFAGTMDFVPLLLMAEEAVTMGFIRDHAQVRWYPAGDT